ncbi:lanthionine synthetase C family protein [Thermostaphylospora chromogena]|uniref:Lanthionine synthetase C-like protein n=1 Tax=Thermostaphylospora chromogena TaxID=35622 RepID=A0A1H1H836_9ACTN|nr:lanthionine synthetase C family protein [Thermostaphylospora chromogena]SDR21655.1 Lanthionine synthetase C-like protein [Thermostaphylospora chromogena]
MIAPALRERAVATAVATMETLRDRERLADRKIAHPITGRPEVPWTPHSLDHGDIGLAVACAAFDELWPDGGWDVAGRTFVRAAIQAGYPHSPTSLFGGVAGLAFALRALSRGGERYPTAIGRVEAVLFARVEAFVDALPSAGGLAEADFDVISGLAGTAAHLVTAAPYSPPAARLLERIMTRFTAWADEREPLGFWTPPERVGAFEREYTPQLRAGYLNLGVAHGIAGVLGAACLAHLSGRCDLDLRPLISSLAGRLCAAVRTTPWGADIPYHEGPQATGPTRTAWCYGNPGVARMLQLAARCCDRPEWEAVGAALLRDALARDAEARNIASTSFCHGAAGMVHLLRRFLEDAAEPDPVLAGHLERELAELLDRYDPAARFGYRDLHPHAGPQDHPGLLEGAAGVAAVLAAFGSDTPMLWERAFLTG